MSENIIRSLFISMTLIVGGVGLLFNYLGPYLPACIHRAYAYGKLHSKVTHQLVMKAEVPKRWFLHFYMFAAPASAFTLYLVVRRYILGGTTPECIFWILDELFGTPRTALVTAESTFLAAALMCVQCSKRLYESLYVNVFSDSKMSFTHYMAGHLHYAGTMAAIIGESDGFVRGTVGTFSWNKITFLQLLCAVIFLTASYMQLRTNFILRKLRENEDGKVVSVGYKIPHGELFEYVSSALQFTEIIMYLVLSIILWQSYTYHYVTLWVVVNQTETALLTHWWYQKTFPNYPNSRKILIPYFF